MMNYTCSIYFASYTIIHIYITTRDYLELPKRKNKSLPTILPSVVDHLKKKLTSLFLYLFIHRFVLFIYVCLSVSIYGMCFSNILCFGLQSEAVVQSFHKFLFLLD